MAVSMYQIGVGGLLTAQKQLAVTGHNIANVNTDGFSRQRADQITSDAQWASGNYWGTGVGVGDVRRMFDQFAYREQLSAGSKSSYASSMSANLGQLDAIMSDNNQVFDNNLNQFYTAVNGIVDVPNDPGIRQIMLDQSQVLSDQFNSQQTNLRLRKQMASGEIEQMSKRVSDIAVDIAGINKQLLASQGTNLSAGQPNDLLDKRDQLINELSSFTDVSTVLDNKLQMTVMIGQGSTIVTSDTAFSLQVVAGDPDTQETQLVLKGPKSSMTLDEFRLGGKIEAAFNYRDNYLKTASSELDLLALSISDTLNQSQANGLDLNGLQGNRLFTDINTAAMQSGRVFNNSNNTGTLQGQVQLTNTGQLTPDEYKITSDGLSYSMENLTSGSITALGAVGAGSYTTGAGFDFIETAGASAAGDSFLIRPLENGAANMRVELTQTDGIAASSAVGIRASEHNVSPGTVSISQVNDPVAAQAMAPLTVEVLEAPAGSGIFNYDVLDSLGVSIVGGPQAYTPPLQSVVLPPAPGAPVMSIEIEGMPSGLVANAPEQYFIEDVFGSGNGENALAMAKTQNAKVLYNGQQSFSSAFASSTSKVGAQAASAELSSSSQSIILEQAKARMQSVSGVNLDEEAANMLQYQQAYQAAAQVISVANTLFDTLLQSL